MPGERGAAGGGEGVPDLGLDAVVSGAGILVWRPGAKGGGGLRAGVVNQGGAACAPEGRWD